MLTVTTTPESPAGEYRSMARESDLRLSPAASQPALVTLWILCLSPRGLGNSRESVCQSLPGRRGGCKCWLRAGAALRPEKIVGHRADEP